ncbi:MAG: sialate O-acetylesterase, partial [Candidatus Sumerlaeota bacterium]|nr:sialate O-acetylesterase [Candidatus Sumerlaeota bacterium]
MKKTVVATLAWIALAFAARADVKLPALFSDNMVLQQGMEVPLWGWADDGEKVTVEFEGQKVEATARGGAWKVELAALQAGGPFEMKVAGKNTITVHNVLVGEVWVCGGQSNMALQVGACENAQQELAASENPQIRLFKVAAAAADEPQKDVKGAWAEAGPKTVAPFSATGYFFGRALQKALNRPVGLIESCIGGTNATSWTSRAVLASDPIMKKALDAYEEAAKKYPQAKAAHDQKVKEWQESVKQAKAAGKTPPARPLPLLFGPMGPENPMRPSAYYNGMLAPLQPYAIKGAIWYQGESNAGDPEQYKTLFPAMIKNWRGGWGEGDFPFLFVQLPGYGPGASWPAFREAQTKALELKNTGMAVAIDVGDKTDIHPKKKQPVGERLARVARVVVYGEKIECCGPTYEAVKFDGAKAVLTFQHADGGLEARGGELKGFTIAGEDKKFVDAKAEINPSAGSGQAPSAGSAGSPQAGSGQAPSAGSAGSP